MVYYVNVRLSGTSYIRTLTPGTIYLAASSIAADMTLNRMTVSTTYHIYNTNEEI